MVSCVRPDFHSPAVFISGIVGFFGKSKNSGLCGKDIITLHDLYLGLLNQSSTFCV